MGTGVKETGVLTRDGTGVDGDMIHPRNLPLPISIGDTGSLNIKFKESTGG